MNRRRFLLSSAAASTTLSAAPNDKPNVVIFLVDDMGFADIGPYGVKDTKTPNLDRLAKSGVKFFNSYSNGPVCTPTRCGLMTGRYQQRYGLEWAILPAQKEAGLSADEPTLPRILGNAGYKSGMFGKWHLGADPKFGPIAHGFGEFFGILGGNVDLYTHDNINGTHDLWEGVESVRREGYLTELLTDRAVKFVDAHAKEPFFLYVPFNSVHWPFQPPGRPDKRTRETWMAGSRADYVKMVESIDKSVGEVLAAVDRNKLTEKTLVVFTNDNGGERFSRNEPAFHHKATLWEGGIRVPTIMRWPGHIPAGKTSRQPMMTMDITATVVVATGAKAPADRPLEGIDLVPIVSGKQPQIERTFFWRIDRDDRKQKAVRKGNWKYIRDGAIEMLFDVEKDPSERMDLAPENPDILAQLREAVAGWERDLAKHKPAVVVK
jgi:arylsulfatase A-like enzyme